MTTINKNSEICKSRILSSLRGRTVAWQALKGEWERGNLDARERMGRGLIPFPFPFEGLPRRLNFERSRTATDLEY